MDKTRQKEDDYALNNDANNEKRRLAMQKQNEIYRERLRQRDPKELARLGALSLQYDSEGKLFLSGDHYLDHYRISWPDLHITVSGSAGMENPARLQKQALWLHYLDRADGSPLAGRWVNLSEIGGLFYQQAFQGYCGDELAAAWKGEIEGLRKKCLAAGGWEIRGMGDLAFEWRVLPRLPLCLCYRLPVDAQGAWATVLFDAAADRYVAADVAAVEGKELADRLKPEQ